MSTKADWIFRSEFDKNYEDMLRLDPAPWYVPTEVKEDLLERYNWSCAVCHRSDLVLHVDHIVPISKGGTAAYKNLQILCQRCNLAKGNNFLHQDSYRLGRPVVIYSEDDFRIRNMILDIIERENT